MIFQGQPNIYPNIFDGVESFLLFKIIKNHSSLLYIVEDNNKIALLESRLRFFFHESQVIAIPELDCSFYDPISPTIKDSYARIFGLFKILMQENKPFVVITTIKNILKKSISPSSLIENSVDLRVNSSNYSLQFIARYLTQVGYQKVDTAEYTGQFASRGSILDIMTNESLCGYRLDFVGNTLNAIKVYDPFTQISYKKIESLTIIPIAEIVLTEKSLNVFQRNYTKIFGKSYCGHYESVINGVREYGIESWLPLFYDDLSSIFDYMPANFQMVFSSKAFEMAKNMHEEIESEYQGRVSVLSQDLAFRPLPPSMLFITRDEFSEKLVRILDNTTYFANYNLPESKKDVAALIPKLAISAKLQNKACFEIYVTHFKSWIQENHNNKIIIAINNKDSLAKVLKECKYHDLVAKEVSNFSEVIESSYSIYIANLELQDSFSVVVDDAKFFIISDLDLFASKKLAAEPKKVKNDPKRLIQALNQLNVGELVVHSNYGLGLFRGLKALEINGLTHDFLEIHYYNDDKLYLPVENFELLNKYGQSGVNVQLDKLGSANWQARKAKLKERIKLAADVLLKTAALRNETKAIAMTIDHEIYQKFCKKFPYIETDDQKRAIEETLNDIALDKPMDRLVCGDVGFGKTEVALRAAAVATLGNQKIQVAIVVPTTLLSRQHMKTFTDRFEGWHVSIKQLSKFTKSKEVKSIKDGIRNGDIDIVIGTHALLAKDIEFKNLGLVIIDEEQHFGVGQKEKLKQLKSNAHILTLSATPIPRTLQMSIVGIKELSIISTPPIERQAVKTFVVPYDEMMIVNALKKEKARNGRVFYITPRISYINDIAKSLSRIVPDMKVAIANGSMSASTLDGIMNDFYDGKYDILLSTSIVESGLDIPAANTLIVDSADMFGLAQLYQIRGRVGRSNIPAFAYFTTPKNRKLTNIAEKKLVILQSLNELGAGMSLASHDMDIRGFGNLLGEEQSGHIKEIGIELYQSMFADAVAMLKSDSGYNDIQEEWSPVINLDLSIQIPIAYISDDALRLSLYRKISALATKEEIECFIEQMIDRFGVIPEETKNLFKIVELKQSLKKANISQLDLGHKGMLIKFYSNKLINRDNIIALAEKNKNWKIRPDCSIFIAMESNNKSSDIVDKVQSIICLFSDQRD